MYFLLINARVKDRRAFDRERHLFARFAILRATLSQINETTFLFLKRRENRERERERKHVGKIQKQERERGFNYFQILPLIRRRIGKK